MLKIPILDEILLQFTDKSPLDNLCDRAHYLLTTVMLFYVAVLIAGKQTFGEPIRCMTPGEYNGAWAKYVNEYCFSTHTYVDALGGYDEKLPGGVMNIGYYQWVPYVLLAQAALFYLPHSIWNHMLSEADLDFETSVKQAVVVRQHQEPKKRELAKKKLAAYLNRVNRQRRKNRSSSGLGSNGSLVYVGSKLLNLINVVAQFVFVAHFVGQGRLDWGLKLARDAFNGIHWPQGTGLFPRVAYCKFLQHTSQTEPQQRMSQCALMINMLNEKVFAVIYFWFLFLAVFTAMDLLYSATNFLLGYGRIWFGRDYLSLAKGNANSRELITDSEMRQFIWNSLGNDGLLLFNFIDNIAGGQVAAEIASAFFTKSRTDPNGLLDGMDLRDDHRDDE